MSNAAAVPRGSSLIDVELFLPGPRQAFSGVRAEEKARGFWYLLNPAMDSLLPFEKRALEPGRIDRFKPPTASEIHIAVEGVSAFEMARRAAAALVARRTPAELGRIGALIYCHSSIDEDIASSTACRLQHELGLKAAFPFSVSQIPACCFFVALDIAGALMNGPERMERILVVAAEKWLFPFLRAYGSWAVFEDGAAAALLGPPGDDAVQVLGAGVDTEGAGQDPFSGDFSSWKPDAVRRGASVIARTLRDSGVDAADLAFAVAPNVEPQLAMDVFAAAGVPAARVAREASRAGYLCSVESLVNLAFAETNGLLAPGGGRGLIWNTGLGGESGCCLVAARPSTGRRP